MHVVLSATPLPLSSPLTPSSPCTLLPSVSLCVCVCVCVCVYVCTSQVRTRDLGGYSTASEIVHAVVENLVHRPVY